MDNPEQQMTHNNLSDNTDYEYNKMTISTRQAKAHGYKILWLTNI